MDDISLAANVFEITPWQTNRAPQDITSVKSFRDLVALTKSQLVFLLPEYSAEEMKKIKPLFVSIGRMLDYFRVNYCALSLSDLVLECEFDLIKDRACPKAIIGLGCGEKFKEEICKTHDLLTVLQDPILKKQVYLDVRELFI